MSRRTIPTSVLLWALLLACVVGWVNPQVSIDYRRARWSEPEALLFLPTGDYLESASLGFETLVADALYLWSIQYYGHHRTLEGRRYLWRIFDVITDLDPAYQDAYLTGALIMAMDMGDPELAIRLLEKGAARNPQEWIYLVDAGHYAWLNLNDHTRAAAYFDRAIGMPGVPAVIRRVRAAMDEYAGNKQEAMALWIDVMNDADAAGDERIEAIAWQHVFDLKVEIDLEVLRVAVGKFAEDRGTYPADFATLVQEGYMDIVPLSPEGEDYRFDAATGHVQDPREDRSRAAR